MTRCLPKPSSHRATWRALLIAAVFSAGVSAMAQLAVRAFPPATQRAAMQISNPPELLLNGKPERLSPGARIHSDNNMLVLSGALVGKNLLVNYVREPHGLVHEVWILTEDEARQVLPTGGITLIK